MAFIQGLTTFKVNDSVRVENISSPGFDNFVLNSIEGTTYTTISDDFPIGASLGFYYSNDGIKTLVLTAKKIINGLSYSSSTTATFSVGYAPEFSLYYPAGTTINNYVQIGKTFGIGTTQENSPTAPLSYSWAYGGAITYSSPSTIPNIISYSTTGYKRVGLTLSNSFGSKFSGINLIAVSTPVLTISGTPTFGNIVVGNNFTVSANLKSGSGHLISDVRKVWIIDGITYEQESVTSSFGTTGAKGVTLQFYSNLLDGLSGSTYAAYTAIQNEIGFYVDPETVIAFIKGEPEYSAYETEILKYAKKYKYLNPVQVGDVANSTYEASILKYETFTEAEKNGPIMVNAEYPWLNILSQGNDEGVESGWQTNSTVVQESKRQGLAITNDLSRYKELGVNCWKDISNELKARGASKVIHYATTGQAFSDYRGIPVGYMAYGPLTGVTSTHYWYNADSVFNKDMRDSFDSKISNNVFGELLKANSNADSFGAAAYSFIPNSGRGLCGMAYWGSTSIVLNGYSGGSGTTFINPTDFMQDVLEDAVKVTSGRMWKEFYRACVRSNDLGFCQQSDIPTTIAAIITPSIYGFFIPSSPGGGWVSTFKWHGVLNKGITKTAENEVASIFSNQSRVNYYGYTGDVKPKEVWIWDSVFFYYISVPRRAIANPNAYTESNLSTWMTRNYMEREFFKRPSLPDGDSLWSSGSTLDQANYYKNNCLSDQYWNIANSVWWGYSGGTLTSLLPSPCVLDSSSLLAPKLNFTKPILQSDVIRAMKHIISQHYVDLVKKMRQTLDSSV